MKTKVCTKCGIEKKLSEFHKAKYGKFGRSSKCAMCCKKYSIKNRKRLLRYRQEYYQKNKKEIYRKNRESISGRKPQVAEYQKQYRLKNKKKINKQQKMHYELNKEEILIKQKEYNLKNRERIKKYKLAYFHNQCKNDIVFKIKNNLRHRIYMVLNGKNKSLSTMFLIGCEIDYLMYHLQCQFTKGMSWDNYGLWHIDHIKPCAKFDLSKPSQQRKCFHYTNLQPLWAIDNLRKGNKYNT